MAATRASTDVGLNYRHLAPVISTSFVKIAGSRMNSAPASMAPLTRRFAGSDSVV